MFNNLLVCSFLSQKKKTSSIFRAMHTKRQKRFTKTSKNGIIKKTILFYFLALNQSKQIIKLTFSKNQQYKTASILVPLIRYYMFCLNFNSNSIYSFCFRSYGSFVRQIRNETHKCKVHTVYIVSILKIRNRDNLPIVWFRYVASGSVIKG